MDGINEKKWFVYIGDHHEGPYSLAEIQTKMSGGQVNSNTYVWAEGMADWKVLSDVPAFTPILNGRESAANHLTTLQGVQAASPMRAAAGGGSAAQFAAVGPLDDSVGPTPAPIEDVAGIPDSAVPAASKARGLVMKLAVLFLVLLIPVSIGFAYRAGYLAPVLESPGVKAAIKTLTDTIQPYVLQGIEKFPAIGKWVSPIESLEDVDPAEYEKLRDAASASLKAEGAKAAFALSKSDLLSPQFYIASNLPDGANFEIHLIGQPDTLLSQTSFSGTGVGTLTKRLAKTSPIRFADGKPVPRGEYDVYVMETSQQVPDVAEAIIKLSPSNAKLPAELPAGRKLVLKQTVFLGGVKDDSYRARLKEFHDKLQAKATEELTEIQMFSAELTRQLEATQNVFTEAKKKIKKPKAKIPPAVAKEWGDFHSKWTLFETQMNEKFSKLTPESLDKDYFYGALYRATQDGVAAVTKVHHLHQSFFDGTSGTDPKAFDIQVEEARSTADAALRSLQVKVDQAKALGTTPSGMPRRDGI